MYILELEFKKFRMLKLEDVKAEKEEEVEDETVEVMVTTARKPRGLKNQKYQKLHQKLLKRKRRK